MFFSFFRIFDVPYASFKIHSPPLNNPYMPPLWSLCEVVLCSPVGANSERRQNEPRTKADILCFPEIA